MLAFLNQVRKPTLDLPLDVRRKMWFKPFMQSYLVVFIGYLTMYLIRKNFNIAQNDMISTYGLSMTQLGMIGLGFSITYGVGKTLVSYYADGKNTKQFLPFMLILSAICMLGFSASMGAGSTSLFLMIAFYALSGFFQSTGGSCSYSTITKWTPRRKRGTFLGFWNISHNLGGAGAAGVALCLGADFVKVNPPKPEDGSSPAEALKVATMASGRTGLVCAGGSTVDAETFLTQLYDQIHTGGAVGNATGRNIHQRSLDEAVRLTKAISAITLADYSVEDALDVFNGDEDFKL